MITNLCSKQVRIILLALTLMVLFGCSQAAPKPTLLDTAALQQPSIQPETLPTKTYVNTKYAFTFSYPRIFERRKDYQDGDGMYFMTDDASLLIWGTSVASKQNLMHNMNTVQENELTTSDSYTIRTYDKNDLRFCYGSKQKDDIKIQVQFTYPIDQEEHYSDVVSLLIEEIASNE